MATLGIALAMLVLTERPASTMALKAKAMASWMPADPAQKYIFMSHHKTGTILMLDYCIAIARVLSNGTEQCHWCFEARDVSPDGSLICAPSSSHPYVERGSGTFTVVSKVNATGLSMVRRWAPNYKAIHMVREPLRMIVSDLQYDQRLAKERQEDITDIDITTENLNAAVEEQLHSVCKSMWRHVRAMCQVMAGTQGDPSVLELDIGDFEEHFGNTSQRLLTFLFGVDHPRLRELVEAASLADPSMIKGSPHISDHRLRPFYDAKIQKMLAAGDAVVASAASCEGAGAADEGLRFIEEDVDDDDW